MQGLPKAGDGLIQLALLLENLPQAVMCQGMSGPNCYYLTVTGDGLLQLPLVLEGIAQGAMGLGKNWAQAQGLGYAIDGNFMSALLKGNEAEQVQGIDVLGVHTQDFMIKLFRLPQRSGLVMVHGQGQRFRYRLHRNCS